LSPEPTDDNSSASSPGPARRAWRRKWKRAAPERRQAAAASLGDAFRPRRYPGLLWAFLLASLAVHAAAAPFVRLGGRKDLRRVAAADAYLQKVMRTERARHVARDFQQRTPPPPPPEAPEVVVEQAMADSLTSDVRKITEGLLSVELQSEVASYVQTRLRDELAAAAKDIATGRLSPDEIRRLHRSFQDKAHEAAVAWRQDYLQKHQVERAAMSTTEWYESDVSRTLVNNMVYELFHHRHNEAWRKHFVHVMARGNGRDVFIVSGRDFGNRLGLFGNMLQGKRFYNDKPAEGLAEPGAEQARWLLARLKELCDGTSQRYPHNYAPGASLERLIRGFARTYCPHREADVEKVVERVREARAAAAAAAEEYLAKAQGATDTAVLTAARDETLAAVKALAEAAGSVRELTIESRKYRYHDLNRAVKTELLRGALRDKGYRQWIATLVEGLAPLVKDFARGQFKKGIIKHTGGVDEAMKEFPRTVVPLLERDMKRLIPPGRFAEMCFEPYQHTSEVTGRRGPPSDDDAKAARALLARAAAEEPSVKAYIEKRREVLADQFLRALAGLAEEMLTRVLTGNLLLRQMGVFVEGVDYADKVQEKLNARAMALAGRGQDLAKLTSEGVPDTSAPLVALMLGAAKGDAAGLEAVATSLFPAALAPPRGPRALLSPSRPRLPGAPAGWGFETQAEVRPEFRSPRFEAIPFLRRFPRLDGDLGDWGRIRPLILRPGRDAEPVCVYAAWNYQGFFFGYTLRQDAERFYWPSLWRMGHNHNTGGVSYRRVTGVGWAYRGDYFRLMFDTLDARNEHRGEPHTQEFVVFPRGIESDPNVPGVERVIRSQRDAQRKEYRGIKSSCEIFPVQPPPDSGPDGSGAYRVTRFGETAYTVEVFIPRSLLDVPVFAPGWYVGFDCVVAGGVQPGHNNDLRKFNGQAWATGDGNTPDRWGDLLLLGTDPRIVLQAASRTGELVDRVIPGHSYLLTVVDPDRNVNPAIEDSVLVSAEIVGGADRAADARDVEVYILSETGRNTGVFRGYVNTQPGAGRERRGVLEVMPLDEVRLGYVDFGNARGERNVVSEVRLPVVAAMTEVLAVGR